MGFAYKHDDPEQEGCRPCCSFPHGKWSLISAITVTIAWVFSMVAVNNCHFLKPQEFLYCHPPPKKAPVYGSCGDCHCINGEDPCPTDPDEIPFTDVPDDWLRQLKNMNATNPYVMKCNPYNTTGAVQSGTCTVPAQEEYQLELWETAACGIKYDMDALDEEQCPTKYTMKTYDSEQEMIEDGAEMTHWGACGACSTTQDLAVYLEYPDLTGKGQECGIRFLAAKEGTKVAESTKCFMEVGYTHACAEMWTYNVQNTRDHCFDPCIDFTFLSDGANNGPPPECKIANCLLCDEQMSGPGFQSVAARSRRRSGLLSKIVRDCKNLLIVDHKPPCNVTRAALEARRLQGQNSAERMPTMEKWRPPEPTETCVYINSDMGLGGYAGTSTNNWLGLPQWLFTDEDKAYNSVYSSCQRYDFNKVMSGFWANQKDLFGAAYSAALTFGFLACFFGGIILCFHWCSTCVAYSPEFWLAAAIIYCICGVFMFFTLTFYASEICSGGCEMGQASAFAIVAGILWIAAGVFTAIVMKQPHDKSIPKSTCCCCPLPIANPTYSAVDGDDVEAETTQVEVTETKNEDGSTVVEKTTTSPNGSKKVERTVYNKSHQEEAQAEESQAELAKAVVEVDVEKEIS